MKMFGTALLLMLLGACVASSEPRVNQAVEDFIVVSQLPSTDKIRTRGQFDFSALTERYVILNADKNQYLVQFGRRCHELNERTVTPDIRYDRNVLRARFDTLRGCTIDRIYPIDEGAAAELEALVERAAETS